ncbi:leucyl aminopeptidase [bacterium]|jgi:leucyl aminopeptidase|nr:leucyl aminopeptidase [bacterium]
MKLSVQSNSKAPKTCDFHVLLVCQNKNLTLKETPYEKETKTIIDTVIEKKIFTAKKGETKTLFGKQSVILVGLGEKEKLTPDTFRQAIGTVSRLLESNKSTNASITMDSDVEVTPRDVQAMAEGFEMGHYSFTEHLTKKKTKEPITNLIFCGLKIDKQDQEAALNKGLAIGKSVNIARDLANAPANYLTPTDFVSKAKKHFEKSDVEIEIIDHKQAEKAGMGGLLGVSKGSIEKPYLLVLKYLPNKDEKPICLVGKGVTFDSGGISIKPSSKMSEMKADMSGAAAVFGAMSAVNTIGYKKNIIGIMPLTENMPANNALKPGDVITISNGKTVEILNTDAEGRLILADAISHAVTLEAKEIVDLATLTGACLVALGTVASGLFSNSDSLIKTFEKGCKNTGEELWHLPLYEQYKDLLKSDIADISNCYEGRFAGASTAAIFLQEFVAKTPWVHLDIAPTMSNGKSSGADVKGMSGSGVRTLIEYLDN